MYEIKICTTHLIKIHNNLRNCKHVCPRGQAFIQSASSVTIHPRYSIKLQIVINSKSVCIANQSNPSSLIPQLADSVLKANIF